MIVPPAGSLLPAIGAFGAHGLGGRTDLPPNPGLAAVGAAIAVGVSFVLVLLTWPEHERDAASAAGRPVPRLARFVDSRTLTWILRALVLAATILVIAIALFGAQAARFNLAPYALYVVFWVGLALVSVLFGPVWRRVNPLRTLHRGLCRLGGRDPRDAMWRLNDGVGMWPAAAMLLFFVWLELVYPQRAEPFVVGLYLTTYCVVTVLAALIFGVRWFNAGDGFEVYSRLLGSLSPLGRDPAGRLVLRSPLRGVAALPHVPGLAAVVIVLIGSTGFDGLTRTTLWQANVPPDSVPLGTLGLFALVAAVGLLYVGALRVSAAVARVPASTDLPGLFAHSLVPIALGYTIAHYFSFFVFEGQTLIALISDPFDLGWDLFGTYDRAVNYELLGTAAIARIQVYAIVVGHICGVIAAHERAHTLLRDPAMARRSQYPLAVVMVTITLCGVLLLLSG